MNKVWLLDYGTGNVQSVLNSIEKLGWQVQRIESKEDFKKADKIIFPGVGAFENAMKQLESLDYIDCIKEFIQDKSKTFMGICIGMQVLFEGSEEHSLDQKYTKGLGILPGYIKKFSSNNKAVPHMGWNSLQLATFPDYQKPKYDFCSEQSDYYFVHSFALLFDPSQSFSHLLPIHTLTRYQDECFVSSVLYENVFATQFHPEKSGKAGLKVIEKFLNWRPISIIHKPLSSYSEKGNIKPQPEEVKNGFCKRIIACLDVRTDDDGKWVVTKGNQYKVREETNNKVRDLGNPLEMSEFYYEQNVDELTLLNITSFRNCPLQDLPMLRLLKDLSRTVFVPLTIGGGINDFELENGDKITALDIADVYFRAGADKISIGSAAVGLAIEFYSLFPDFQPKSIHDRPPANTFIHSVMSISRKYGRQAVVLSIDPKAVYVDSPDDTSFPVVTLTKPNSTGQKFAWYQCTMHGGRLDKPLCVQHLCWFAQHILKVGEILVNAMDRDGTKQGYDCALLAEVKKWSLVPVVASSGAGCKEDFSKVFQQTNVEAALAAGIFHRKEVTIREVKEHCQAVGIKIRM